MSQPVAEMDRVCRKTFRNALIRELRKHVPTLGELTAAPLADHIEALVEQFFPPRERLRFGQLLWPGVDERERQAYGKRIEHTRIFPVALDVVTLEDMNDHKAGVGLPTMRRKVLARLFRQAHEQGALLTTQDVALMLHLTVTSVGNYLREIETGQGAPLPRRGTLQDFGPTITHKLQICHKVMLEGRSIEQTARETAHSPEAVTRYVRDYRRVATALAAGLSVEQTAYTAKMSVRLVKEYQALIEQHRLDRAAHQEV